MDRHSSVWEDIINNTIPVTRSWESEPVHQPREHCICSPLMSAVACTLIVIWTSDPLQFPMRRVYLPPFAFACRPAFITSNAAELVNGLLLYDLINLDIFNGWQIAHHRPCDLILFMCSSNPNYMGQITLLSDITIFIKNVYTILQATMYIVSFQYHYEGLLFICLLPDDHLGWSKCPCINKIRMISLHDQESDSVRPRVIP